jgi:predicted outer membrane lipoprotein
VTNEPFFALICTAMIGLLFGSVLALAGYRFFLFLLPVWGFFFGFALGAQGMQAIFGSGFLVDLISWVVGLLVGLACAVFSYLFFAGAVAIAVGSLGYTVGTGLMLAIGFDMGFLAWIVGIALAVVFVIGTFYLSLYKWAIIIATSIAGAAVVVGTFLLVLGKLPPTQLVANPVKYALNDSPFWVLIAIVVAVLGFAVQYQTTRYWTLRDYNRWGQMNSDEDAEAIVSTSTT